MRARFQTAEEFRKAADEYFAWADENPVRLPYRSKAKGDASSKTPTEREQTDEYAKRPYTLQELAYHLHVGKWTTFVRDNCEREGFAEVIEDVENRITSQQLVGAMVGLYRENIVARINGIFDSMATITPPQSTIEIECVE